MRIREKHYVKSCTRISRLVLEPKGLYFHTRAQQFKRENRGSVNRLRGHRSWPARFLQTDSFCFYPKWFLLNRERPRIRDGGATWIVAYWWCYTGRFATLLQRCVALIITCDITLKRWHRVAKTWTSKGQWGRPTSNEGHSTAETELVPAIRKFLYQNKNKWF